MINEDISLTERYMLVSYVTGESFNQVQLKHKLGQQVMTEQQQNRYIELLFRRMEGEPIQYIIGYTDFYGRDFLCEENVLIPRFDTECLIDAILPQIKEGDSVADICCGTGCIGLTLALEKDIKVVLADISPYALELTRKNSEKFTLSDKVNIIKHDVFNDELQGEYSLIVSNPPYIRSSDMATLSAEVKREPSLALDGGADGLDFYRHMIAKYKSNLKSGGIMAFECGYDQADSISKIFEDNGFCNIKKFKDYNNIERVVVAEIVTA
ncbi:MAG: peptide chain release factor N(5)-glutamine methyltransferase [Ruminococcus sp.]|nr:peptide chain release factor N(5)-glutamine methyltransferase [Ruminococcus sp.]